MSRVFPGRLVIMRKKNSTVSILIALFVVLIAGIAYMMLRNPADETGTISGYIQDSVSGAPIRGVDVTAIDEEEEKYTAHENTDTTGKDGYFELELPSGEYTLLFEANEYESLETNDSYTVKSGESNDISKAFTLEPLSAAEPPAEEPAPQPAEPETTAPQPAVAEQSNDNFVINSSQIEDYSLNLVPENYLSYHSGTDRFYFSYPPNLYNHAESNYDSVATPLGTSIESHTFTGSEGSSLTFSLFKRDDRVNIDATKDKALAAESAEITKSKKVLLDAVDDDTGYGTGVVTGFNSAGNIIYTLIKVTPANVMEMRIECPDYKNSEDKLMKRYVQECIYRYCGFASEDAKDPRSYSEYIDAEA